MFYYKKRQAIKYINNSNEYQLEVEWLIKIKKY
jgi:hypothetical protein